MAALARKLTSAWIWSEVRRWPKLLGMIPALKPDGRYAYGFVIAVRMHCCRVAPRIRLEAALAQSALSRVSRFGPTAPVALAAASV